MFKRLLNEKQTLDILAPKSRKGKKQEKEILNNIGVKTSPMPKTQGKIIYKDKSPKEEVIRPPTPEQISVQPKTPNAGDHEREKDEDERMEKKAPMTPNVDFDDIEKITKSYYLFKNVI